jgi:hypothetical protein
MHVSFCVARLQQGQEFAQSRVMTLPIGGKRRNALQVSFKKNESSDAMLRETSMKTVATDARQTGLRAFLVATLLVVSALMHATIAPHAALSTTLELCVDDHAPTDNKAANELPALGGKAHCGACPIATAPFIPEKPLIARVEQSPTSLVYFDAWTFNPQERRRPGETRSRAPPLLS